LLIGLRYADDSSHHGAERMFHSSYKLAWPFGTTSSHLLVRRRWTSTEGIGEQKYSTASDVWSFAITLVEMFQEGDRPFSMWPRNAFVAFKVHMSHSKHPKPAGCPDLIYDEVIMPCMEYEPTNRPSFPELLVGLEHHLVAVEANVPV